MKEARFFGISQQGFLGFRNSNERFNDCLLAEDVKVVCLNTCFFVVLLECAWKISTTILGTETKNPIAEGSTGFE